MTNKEYLEYLVKELKKEIPFQWKVQSVGKGSGAKAQCVAYLDSRDVCGRLNEVCKYGWESQHILIGDVVYCRLTIIMPDGTRMNRTDAGNSDNPTETDKTAASDSLKRAAVQLGLGSFLYDKEIVWMDTIEINNKNVPAHNGKRVYDLTAHINDVLKKGVKTTPPVESTPISDPMAPTVLTSQGPGKQPVETPVEKAPEAKKTRVKKDTTVQEPTVDKPASKKEWLNPDHPRWAYCVDRLKGNVQIDFIKTVFSISAENEAALLKAAGKSK